MNALRQDTQVTINHVAGNEVTTLKTSFVTSDGTCLGLSVEITGEPFNNIMTNIGLDGDCDLLSGCIIVPSDFNPVALFVELAHRTEQTGVLPSVDVVFEACLFISLV